MKKENGNIESPALGCKVGQAYQTMLSALATALKDAGLDITTSEYMVLRALYSKDGLQQCEITEMVGKDKAAICRCVDSLERKGLVRTEVVSHKCRRACLTERALEIKPAVMAVAAIRHQALMDVTTPAELEIFTRVLDNIIKSK